MTVRGQKIAPEEIAALLDGELRDSARAEQLSNAIANDPALKAEYEAQRVAKVALNKLALAEEKSAAPDFMSTRILGRIAIEKKVRTGLRLPLLRLAGGAAALFVTGAGTGAYIAMNNRNPEQPAGFIQAEHLPARGLFVSNDSMYQDLQQPELVLPSEGIDPALAQFLQVANDQHSYRKAIVATDRKMGPDIPTALALLNQEGGTVFASDESGDYRDNTVMAGDGR
jgi:hypothetical protein